MSTLDDRLQLIMEKKVIYQDLFRTFLHELMTAKTRVPKGFQVVKKKRRQSTP